MEEMRRCDVVDALIALNLFIFFVVTGNNNGHSNICNAPGEGVFGRTQYPLAVSALANLEYIWGG